MSLHVAIVAYPDMLLCGAVCYRRRDTVLISYASKLLVAFNHIGLYSPLLFTATSFYLGNGL